nr:MAG TPA: ASCH domain protein [Caudoviricetes sp.]
MAIKPILFNTEMVRAILDGRKTCTRRILKGAIPFDEKAEYWNVLKKGEWSGPICVEYFIKQGSPYQPGDILYVRETWHKYTKLVGKGEGCHLEEHYGYKASIANSEDADEPWKPSIHMPKKAARIWLKVTNVSVERLQEITEAQTEEEGFLFTPPCLHRTGENYCDIDGPCGNKIKYCDMSAGELFGKVLWDSTIKKSDIDIYGWDANPWVWVIEFERCEKPKEV